MDKLTLMQRFADPELIKQMTTSEKVVGSLIVAILGMAITFSVLCILWALIACMTKIFYKEDKKVVVNKPTPAPAVTQTNTAPSAPAEEEDEALIAVITAAIAASMQRPVQSIVVKNIKRTVDGMPAWASVAKQEQLDSRRF